MAIRKKGKTWYIDYYFESRRVREAVVSEKKTTTAELVGCYIRVPEGKCSETD